ncbi:hypothetical protein BpHYR1_018250 [Brachionus plicatilis]|uniref:Uncharacterized protein n=1 Tax=Brachionus plicatilis TaxID=10195 RepID=A0A3M7PM28_BRAPC|nr:hypothetical protein BpHYR1_018250 [Brachionus plicatilis]
MYFLIAKKHWLKDKQFSDKDLLKSENSRSKDQNINCNIFFNKREKKMKKYNYISLSEWIKIEINNFDF